MVNIIDITGRLDTTRSNTILIEDISFPTIICSGFSVVVSSISSVCFSLSPAMLPAVKAGIINASITISMPAIIKYILDAAE